MAAKRAQEKTARGSLERFMRTILSGEAVSRPEARSVIVSTAGLDLNCERRRVQSQTHPR
jgi:hypothetical protein